MKDRDYSTFLGVVNRRIAQGGAASLPSIFHSVRRIPYGAAGQRDPSKVFENNVGSCSGKHILLRDLLRNAEFEAEIITIFTHFNKLIPDSAHMPEGLRRMIREEDVPDFHHYVRARHFGGEWHRLDATWHDALSVYGFPVNGGWRGKGHTQLAGNPIEEFPPVEDIADFKCRLLTRLSDVQREIRSRFFDLLIGWVDSRNA